MATSTKASQAIERLAGTGLVRVETQKGLELLHRLRAPPRLEQNPPHGFTHARVFGLKLDRPPEMGQGGLRAALQSQRQTPFQLGIR